MEWYDILALIITTTILFIFCTLKISSICSRKEEQEDEDTIKFILRGKEKTLDDDIKMDEILDQMECGISESKDKKTTTKVRKTNNNTTK